MKIIGIIQVNSIALVKKGNVNPPILYRNEPSNDPNEAAILPLVFSQPNKSWYDYFLNSEDKVDNPGLRIKLLPKP